MMNLSPELDARSSVFRCAGRKWGDWAKWTGGERPISGRTLTQVRLRSGVMSPPVWAAEIIWKHGMLGVTADDVVAYRTAQED